MMFLSTILCAIAAGILAAVVINLYSIGALYAFLGSWLVALIGGGALYAKESALRKGGAGIFSRIVGGFVVLVILATGTQTFLEHWKQAQSLWSRALLVWLALVGLMIVWVSFGGGEERHRAHIEPPAG
jgi:hypothetical protein